MKALILAGGRGRRLEGISQNTNKCMLKLGGKPLIEHNMDNLINAGITEIIIVVGYRAEDIINRYGIQYQDADISYVIQREQKGLVNAMECARDELDGDDFMLSLGDEILVKPKHREMIRLLGNDFGVCGVVFQDDKKMISKTYTIAEGYNHHIIRLIEKPKKVFNHIMGTGNCIFKNDILSYINRTPINHERGEKELPDLVQCAIDDGNVVKSFIICDKYFNINSEEDLRQAEMFL